MARLLLLLAVVLGIVAPAAAHDSRPVVVSIEQQADEALFKLRRVVPPSVPVFNLPQIVMPAGCEAAGGQADGDLSLYRCADGVAGRELAIAYPKFNPSLSTMVRVAWTSGETRSIVVPPDQLTVMIPDAETPAGVAGQYFWLGVEHILIGYDHLLFLACLLLIAGTFRRVLITITGFTLAHSVTLALAALDVVRVPVPAVEATIALSIVFLATEIARPRRDTLTWRYPVLVSSAFGLLHGFGFAAVLGEIGMPQTEVPLALLFFNIGVEAGQLLFIAAVMPLILLAGWFVRKKDVSSSTVLGIERPVAYAVGILASYWMIERIAGFAI
jgi:hydrogenase/urease accessory protein HupE